jgi:hypothetical protein
MKLLTSLQGLSQNKSFWLANNVPRSCVKNPNERHRKKFLPGSRTSIQALILNGLRKSGPVENQANLHPEFIPE